MAGDVGLLGVAIALTLAAAAGLTSYESVALRRGWRVRTLGRVGATSLVVGFSLAALVTGKLAGNWFIVPAAGFAALSGTAVMRRGGRLRSFCILWATAAVVVVSIGEEIPAFGDRASDVVLTALLLACFASLVRELDIAGSFGWGLALVAAAATTALAYATEADDRASVALLVTGALFALIAVMPFGSGMLGRMGARLVGLVIGALVIRIAVGSPRITAGVLVGALLCAFAFIATLESPARRRAILGTLAVGGLLAVVGAPAALAMIDLYPPVHDAVATSRGLVSADAGNLDTTSARLTSVEKTLRAASTRLHGTSVVIGRVVPLLSANLRATTASADVAADVATSARRLVDQVNVNDVGMRNATVDRAAVNQLRTGLDRVRSDLARARPQMYARGDAELLVPELRGAVEDLRAQLDSVESRVTTSIEGTQAAQRLLGYDRPRRFFVAVQNNAESRATGGYIGNYGILEANNGHLTLSSFRRTVEFDAAKDRPRKLNAPLEYKKRYSRFDVNREWTNVNMSPDFPTVAKVIVDQYRQFSGDTVDGVLAVDPIALSQLLRLTGPVRVEGWPVPIGAENIVPITLHDEYKAFDGKDKLDERVDFIGRVAKTVFDRLTESGLDDLVKAGSAIHDATSTRHIQLWTNDKPSKEFFRRTHTDGRVARVRGDSVLVTTQNAAGNKTDYFLHRSVTYDATVRRGGGGLRVDATLTITLRNDAPATGEPKYVIGPFDGRYKPGENRTYLTVYSPLVVQTATVDGKPVYLQGAPELGRVARSTFLSIASRTTTTVVVRLSGAVAGANRYGLDLGHQPTVTDDEMQVTIHGAGDGGVFRSKGNLERDVRFVLPIRKN